MCKRIRITQLIRAIMGVFAVLILVIKQQYIPCILFVYLFFFTKKEGFWVRSMNIQNIFYRKSRILRKRIYPIRNIVVLRDVLLGELIPSMNSDRYYMVHIIDEDFNSIGVLTEHQILNSAINNSSSIRVGDLLEHGFHNKAKSSNS